MNSDDARRLAALRDSGMISHAEYLRLTTSPVAPAPPVAPPPPAWAPGHPSRSRLGDLAGTAAAALAGVMAGQALERLLFDDAGAAAEAASTAATEAVEQVDLFYAESTEFLDVDGDGSVDAAVEHESLIVDDGTPTEYTHTEYTEFVDTDGDGMVDEAVSFENYESGEPSTGTWDAGDPGSDDWDSGGFEV